MSPVLPPEPWLHTYNKNPDARNQSIYFQESCSWAEVEASCAAKQSQFLDTYDGSIRYVDESIKRLLSQLKERGVLENTVVVFTSDHGQEFGDHGIYGHGKSLYRQVIQVPLIVWNPALVPASVRVQTPISTTEIPSTILDLAAPDAKQPLPGRSLAALWRPSQPVSDWPEPISELARLHWFTREAPNYNAPFRSIVTPQWKYIRQEGKDLLFDCKTDPNETHDLCCQSTGRLHGFANADSAERMAAGSRPAETRKSSGFECCDRSAFPLWGRSQVTRDQWEFE